MEFEIPKLDRKGIVTTIEGLLTNIINNLSDHISSFDNTTPDNTNSVTDVNLNNKEFSKSLNDVVSVKVDENVYKLDEYVQKLEEIKDKLISYSKGFQVSDKINH